MEIWSELQLVLSMYDPKTQISFDDPELAEQLITRRRAEAEEDGGGGGELSADLDNLLKSSISFTIKLNDHHHHGQVEVRLRIPPGYPRTEFISATCSSRNNSGPVARIARLNQELKNWISEQYSAEEQTNNCDILSVINYCQDYLSGSAPPAIDSSMPSSTQLNVIAPGVAEEPPQVSLFLPYHRLWIYSHHIYNKKKRKFLVDTASDLNLTGFSMPGKPGFICVEGEETDCDEFWGRVRQLTWQKISLITKESIRSQCQVKNKCFTNFTELHLTKSDFIKYLEEKEISSVIKEYLNI